MDIKELEEKRRRLQEQTKRSSRKVSKHILQYKEEENKIYAFSFCHRRGNHSWNL